MRKSLSKKQILRNKTDIDRVFKAGKKYSDSCFKIIRAENALSYNRLIVIPVKGFGNSVQRNKIRRQVKEIFREKNVCLPCGFDYVVVVFPVHEQTFSEKKERLLALLEKF